MGSVEVNSVGDERRLPGTRKEGGRLGKRVGASKGALMKIKVLLLVEPGDLALSRSEKKKKGKENIIETINAMH